MAEKLKPYFKIHQLEAGLDEAGRGCLAGPVFAAAVVLDPKHPIPGLDDSKALSAEKRKKLRLLIEERALAWCVAQASHEEIDDINILNASFLAMHRSVQGLHLTPDVLLVDGNRFKPFPGIEHYCMVKGDATFQSIAAASILAKEHRDAHMEDLHPLHPVYGWNQNMGYPTPEHKRAVFLHGLSPFHRKSFKAKPPQLKLNL